MSNPNQSLEFALILNQCREKFGSAPRRFGTWDYWTYLKTFPPVWIFGDELTTFFQLQKSLLQTGQVVWGHIVQANGKMFGAGRSNAPGDVVFCTDPAAAVDPPALHAVAAQLYRLKGKPNEDTAKQAIGNHLANEYTRSFGIAIPESVSPLFPCMMSTIQYNRKHLPDGKLSQSFFPLIVRREPPNVAMVLPARYWSAGMLALWK